MFENCTIFFRLFTCFGSVWVLYDLFLTADRFWLCLSIVLSFLAGDRFLHCFSIVPSFSDWWRVLALFEYCTIFFWLFTCFASVWVLYDLFLTADRFWLCLSIVPSFLAGDRFLHCFSIVPSFSDWWRVLALFEYCTIFFWLLAGFGTVWELHHLF